MGKSSIKSINGRYSIAMFDCRKVMQASFATWGKHENCRPGTPATSPARSFPASGTSQGLLTSSGSSLGAGKMKTCRRIAFAIFKLKLAVRKQKDLRAVHLTSGYLWDPPSYLMLQHDTCAMTGSTPSRNVPPFRDTAWVPPTWQTGAEHRPTLQGPRWDHLLADGSCSERRTSEILNWQSQVWVGLRLQMITFLRGVGDHPSRAHGENRIWKWVGQAVFVATRDGSTPPTEARNSCLRSFSWNLAAVLEKTNAVLAF